MSKIKSQVLHHNSKELVLFFAVFLALSFILFGNGIKGDFVLDDHAVVQNRQELSSVFNLPGIFKASWLPGTVWMSNYRPLTLLSFAFNFIFSKGPVGFHVVNILIHSLNVFLIFLIVCKFSSKRSAIIAALLFMFLPIHVEAISSIVGRKDLLGMFFFLLALFYFFEKKHIKSSISFFLALLASDFSIAFLPLAGVLLLIDNRNFIKSLKLGIYYLIPVPIYFLLRYWALGKYVFGGLSVNPIVAPMAFLSFKERFFTGFYNFFIYLEKTFYPVNLSPDYSFNQIPTVHNIFSSPMALMGLIFFAVFIALFIFLPKKFKISLAIFLIGFIVMSDIIFISGGSVAERRWYLPSFGLLLFIAFLIDAIIVKYHKFKYVFGFLGFILAIIAFVVIIKQNNIWLNDHDLLYATAQRSPNSVWTRTNLAAIYSNEKNYAGAHQELEAAFKFSDQYTPALDLWGKLMWREGNYEQAEKAFKRALEYDFSGKSRHIVYRTLALLYFDDGKNGEAISNMEQAIKFQTSTDSEDAQIDDVLYKILKNNRNRSINSYTSQEKQTLNMIIKKVLNL